jgi:hypothetical protein
MVFVIEDEVHASWHGGFRSLDDAVVELRRLAAIPWDQPPNRAPCTNWRTCGRDYAVVEFDDSVSPWDEVRRTPVLEIAASGAKWSKGFEPSG